LTELRFYVPPDTI